MNQFFRPAVGLMNRLKYPQKFLLISLLFAVPLAYMRAQFLCEVNAGSDLAARELAGTAYLRPLRRLLEDIPPHREQAEQVRQNAPATMAAWRLSRDRIDADIADLARREHADGGRFETRRIYESLSAEWQVLRRIAPSLSTEENAVRYTHFFRAILALMSQIGDASTLILDPDLDSYYTMNAIVVDIPNCLNVTSQIREGGDRFAISAPLNNAQSAQFLTFAGLLRQNGEAVQHDSDIAARNNPAGNLQPELSALYACADEARHDLIRCLTHLGEISAREAGQTVVLNAACDRALTAHFALWDHAANALDTLLARRAQAFAQRRTRADEFAFGFLVLVAYVYAGFYRAVMTTVSRLDQAARRMAEGDLSAMAPLAVQSRDELARVVGAFNAVAAQMVREWRQAQDENARAIEAERKYRAIFENAVEGIYQTTPEGRYLSANPALARLYGYTSPEDLIASLTRIGSQLYVDPERRDEFARRIESESALMRFESEIIRQDGTRIWITENARAVRDESGRILYYEGTVRDITERREYQQQIIRLNARLEYANHELMQSYDATIEGWSRALDLRDKETEGHSQRVTELTLRLADAFGIAGDDLLHVRRGALLHDIGKLGIPDSILLKPGKLTEEEWEIMRRHPVYAYEMLREVSFLRPSLDIPHAHHEKWDGTGYPCGLKGEEIPLAARLFAIVDVWDALRSDRPYRPAWPVEKVIEHITALTGTHFDPDVVAAFLRLQRESHLKPVHQTWLAAA